MCYEPVTALQDPDEPIVIPNGATDLHYEGELVVVIGKPVKNVTPEEARAAIFGVTCGNDVSERNWQHGAQTDLQWWRAKGSDTFAPLGPALATGMDYGNLLLQTRLNGEVVQRQYTSDLIFDCPSIVSWVSGWVTLMPGDILYTGTPGATRKLSPGGGGGRGERGDRLIAHPGGVNRAIAWAREAAAEIGSTPSSKPLQQPGMVQAAPDNRAAEGWVPPDGST